MPGNDPGSEKYASIWTTRVEMFWLEAENEKHSKLFSAPMESLSGLESLRPNTEHIFYVYTFKPAKIKLNLKALHYAIA
jgi:hypothetical protein